jgi:hypothetical protein
MMTEQASFTLRNRNPDVLTCIANLSNDEVFTPPELANKMLDMLADAWAKDHKGENIWENKDVKFLDPCTKSGVFLREITARLTQGLEKKIPELEKRVDHILSKQVYGIGITRLTSLLARRSVYCSKSADGEHSIAKSLKSKDGNIWYENLSHSWDGERCQYCGASKSIFNRDDNKDRHAYAFIHANNPLKLVKEIFGAEMEFDVIVGNPPYQLSDGGAKASASPIYQNFVTQAKNLNPRYMSMIIPSRWFSGGKGLDEFRNEMLNDSRLSTLHDFPNSTDCFPGVDLSGGVCYFLWSRDHSGNCAITTYIEGKSTTSIRPLLEKGVESFIRYNEAVSILEKIRKQEGKNFQSFSEIVSSRKPFGFTTDFNDFKIKEFKDSIKFLGYNKIGYVSESQISQNKSWVSRYKVYVSMAYGERISSSYWVLGKPFLGEPGTCCSETYLVIGPTNSKKESTNIMSYMRTRFFRFLVLLNKPTQHATSKVYSFVPIQDFKTEWTDEILFGKYKLNSAEISFIEKMIRPMTSSEE